MPKITVLHSILKIWFGVTPLTDVKIPKPAGVSVRKSSQNGMIALFIVAAGNGQTLVNAGSLLVNCKLPFELTLAVVNPIP